MIDKRFHKGIELKNNLLYFKGINHLPHITDIIHGYNTILEENKRLMKENQELRMSPRVDVNEIESLVCENEKLKAENEQLKTLNIHLKNESSWIRDYAYWKEKDAFNKLFGSYMKTCEEYRILVKENEQLKNRIQELQNHLKRLENENIQTYTLIKEAYNNERTQLGKSVLKQLIEAIQ